MGLLNILLLNCGGLIFGEGVAKSPLAKKPDTYGNGSLGDNVGVCYFIT